MKPALFACVVIGLAAPAVAGAESPPRTLALRHADLDLRREADAREMLRRINLAAMRVCAPDETNHPAILAAHACRHAAVARGVAKLGAPAVTAAYEARAPRQRLAAR